MQLMELKEKTTLTREQAAARLHAIADELGSNNDVVIEREHIRFVAHVPDQVNLKVEFEIEDDGIQIQHLRLEHLLPAERQQLPRERRSALPGLHDLLALPVQRAARRQFVFERFAVSDDHAEQIIEIVRDSAGKLADRFHFLRLAKLFLQ